MARLEGWSAGHATSFTSHLTTLSYHPPENLNLKYMRAEIIARLRFLRHDRSVTMRSYVILE